MSNLPQRLPAEPASLGAEARAAARVVPRAVSRTAQRMPQRTPEDVARLQALVRDHLDRAARIIRALGAPAEELEDLVQQAFSITAARLDDIGVGKERAFLVETAVRLTLDARRARARAWGRDGAAVDLAEVADGGPSPEDLSDQRRALRLLDRVLAAMDESLRTVLVLFEVEEMTMAEIAAVLAIPPGTVASRLRRAREEAAAATRRLGVAPAAAGGGRR
jgi:RNA polymerase sigma-70 factor (ECF subfamily)